MTKRRDPPSRRGDRPTEPHSRLPDAIYYDVLPFITPAECKLWLALKSREWRKDGSRKGLVRKSLRKIAKDINMSRTHVVETFDSLREKGLTEWTGQGIRLLEPDFTTAITTGFTTKGGSEQQAKVTGGAVRGDRYTGQARPLGRSPTGVIPFPVKQLTHGRSVLKPDPASVTPSGSSDAVEVPDAPAAPVSRRARVSAQGSHARSDVARNRKETHVPKETKREEPEGELRVRDMPRDEALALLRRIKAKALAEAEKGTAKLRESSDARRRREEERKAELRRQYAELTKGDDGT